MARKGDGITVRHERECRSREGRSCNCDASYRGRAYDPAVRKHRVTGWTKNRKQAERDLNALRVGIDQAALPTETAPTVRQAIETMLAGMTAGTVLNRSGEPYKPSMVRSYRLSLQRWVTPAFGPHALDRVKRADVQRLIEEMATEGKSASTIRNTLNALRVLYRWAIVRDFVSSSPVVGVVAPAVRPAVRPDATPEQAKALLACIDGRDRRAWALAFYAGLRAGEIMALRWEDVDFSGGAIYVRRAWDPKAKVTVLPKTASGARRVPLSSVLRSLLLADLGSRIPDPESPVVGHMPAHDVNTKVRRRCVKAGATYFGLHSGRHSWVTWMLKSIDPNAGSLMDEIGKVSRWAGHSSITVTLGIYFHVTGGTQDDAMGRFDRMLG